MQMAKTLFDLIQIKFAELGEDADTTAAIAGQLAGAMYGVNAIPANWLQVLHMQEEISAMARALHAVAS